MEQKQEKKFIISEGLFNAIFAYLNKRPREEVDQFFRIAEMTLSEYTEPVKDLKK